MRLWTYLLDAPVVAILTFVFFFLMDKPNRNLGACLTGVVCIGFIPLSAWFHMVRHPGDYRGERKLAFVLSIVGYMIGTIVMVVFFRQARLFLALMLSYMFTVVGLVIINLLHYKASGHAAGVSGPATAITIRYGWPGAISYLLLVLVAIAKINIKEHTLGQLCTGAGITIVSTLTAFVVTGMLRF
jgi:hypothetical protein